MNRRLLTLFFALTSSVVPMADAAPKKPVTKKDSTTVYEKPAPVPALVYADEPTPTALPAIAAGAALLVDASDGSVLYEMNADVPRPVASTQKLLTGLIIAEAGNLDRMVTIQTSDTRAEPTKLYMKAGERYRRSDLLRMLLVKSMNDVALALARDNAGSVAAFAEKMNARARQLGMRNSHFVNPNGLPAPGQHSTPRDMARVALYAYRNRTVRSYVSLRETSFRFNDGRVRTYSNTNKVLLRWPLCNGMKTGYTNAAGRCLISSAYHDGRHLISLIFNDKQVWDDSYKMLNWGLATAGAD
jgi:serine-type D-Ala-D-Ala carboxypeptidase (penicillin-binding protein 5/6)